LLGQQVAVVCLALVELVHTLEQLLLLGVVLMQLLVLWVLWVLRVLREVRRDVGRTNRRGARSGYGGGRITEGMGDMTREGVAGWRDVSGVPEHEMNGLLLVCAYCFLAKDILQRIGVACQQPTPVNQALLVIRRPRCQ
jgi:hypothetical protein